MIFEQNTYKIINIEEIQTSKKFDAILKPSIGIPMIRCGFEMGFFKNPGIFWDFWHWDYSRVGFQNPENYSRLKIQTFQIF